LISIWPIILLFLYTPAIFSLGKQSTVVDYPDEWYELRELLLSQDATQYTLIFPWHQYIHLNFVNKVVLNPSLRFFYPHNVITADNIEI